MSRNQEISLKGKSPLYEDGETPAINPRYPLRLLEPQGKDVGSVTGRGSIPDEGHLVSSGYGRLVSPSKIS